MSKKISNLARQGQYQDKYKKNFPYNWFQYCREPLENIEGWSEMLNDTSGQRWCLHHRAEIPDDGEVVSKDELINRGQYYHLAADRLIFMTESDHMSIHQGGELNTMYGRTGELNPMYGITRTGELAPNYGTNKYEITEEELRELYVVQGLTQQEIGEKYGCCRQLIGWYLRRFGIVKQAV